MGALYGVPIFALDPDLMTGFSLAEPSDLRSTGFCLAKMTPEFREFFDPNDMFEVFLSMVLDFGAAANLAPKPLDLDLELLILARCFSMLLLCLSVDLYDPLFETNDFLLNYLFLSPVISPTTFVYFYWSFFLVES